MDKWQLQFLRCSISSFGCNSLFIGNLHRSRFCKAFALLDVNRCYCLNNTSCVALIAWWHIEIWKKRFCRQLISRVWTKENLTACLAICLFCLFILSVLFLFESTRTFTFYSVLFCSVHPVSDSDKTTEDKVLHHWAIRSYFRYSLIHQEPLELEISQNYFLWGMKKLSCQPPFNFSSKLPLACHNFSFWYSGSDILSLFFASIARLCLPSSFLSMKNFVCINLH